jgi:hypothetical protein
MALNKEINMLGRSAGSLPLFGLPLLLVLTLLGCNQSEPEQTNTTPSNAPPSPPAVAAKPSFDLSRADMFAVSPDRRDFSPIGQADCDAFLQFAQRCFSSTTMPAAHIVIEPYFEHFKTLRSLAKAQPRPGILDTLCRQQLDSIPQVKASLACKD